MSGAQDVNEALSAAGQLSEPDRGFLRSASSRGQGSQGSSRSQLQERILKRARLATTKSKSLH